MSVEFQSQSSVYWFTFSVLVSLLNRWGFLFNSTSASAALLPLESVFFFFPHYILSLEFLITMESNGKAVGGKGRCFRPPPPRVQGIIVFWSFPWADWPVSLLQRLLQNLPSASWIVLLTLPPQGCAWHCSSPTMASGLSITFFILV